MMPLIGAMTAHQLLVADIVLEVIRGGAGSPVVLLHGMRNLEPTAPFLNLLGREVEVIAPSHPGFGLSERPSDVETVYDLVHLYLDVLESLPYEKVTLVGFSFGGWLAAEVAIKCAQRLDGLILVDALGLKLSPPETPDILDIFNTSPDEVNRRSWHNPEHWAPDFNTMSDEAIVLWARNWEALCLYGWHPYMYNPQIKRWLHRITCPTLLLWGSSDGIVSPAYGRAYSELIPGSCFELIANAGHHPEIEQPKTVVERIVAFITSNAS